MNILSDTESSDSDTGRRFKTASTRTKETCKSKIDRFDDDRIGGDRNDTWKNRQTHGRSDRNGADGRSRCRSPSPSREYQRDREPVRRRERSSSRGRERASSRGRYTERRRNSRDGERDSEFRNREHNQASRSRGGSRSRRDDNSTSRRNSPITAHDDRPKSVREPRDKRRRSVSRELISARNGDADNKSTSTERDKHRRERHRGDLIETKVPSSQLQPTQKPVARSASPESHQMSPIDDKVKSKHKKHKKHKHKSRHSCDKEAIPVRKDKSRRRSASVEIILESNASESEEMAIDLPSNEFKVIDDLVCGPLLPPHMLNKSGDPSRDPSPTNEMEAIGPRFPPSMSPSASNKASSSRPSNEKSRIKGPMLPSDIDLKAAAAEYVPATDSAVSDISDSDDDSDLIGPIPAGAEKSKAHLELEKRALELKLAKLSEQDECANRDPIREEWMTELPEIRGVAGLGLVARQFRAKERDEIGDRSGWTDTPSDRARKSHAREPTADELRAAKKHEADAVFKAKRDAEQESAARKHKKKHKRDESLLEIHQKKMKKKKEKEKQEEKPVRRPFSRDTDLKVNRFDEAQKRSVIKKAQLLDTRFGSGQSKYL